MQVRIHKPADADAVDAGSLAFASMALAFQEVGLATPPSYDSALFTKLWEADALGFAGAWEGAAMIGCRIVVVSPTLLNPHFRMATTVSIFVAPEHRKKGVATQLILQGDNHLRSIGVWGAAMMTISPSQKMRDIGYSDTTVYMERKL